MFEDTKAVYIVGKTTTRKPKTGKWYITARRAYYCPDLTGRQIEYYDGEWERFDGHCAPHSWQEIICSDMTVRAAESADLSS